MSGRTDTAYSLSNAVGITRVPSLEDYFDTAKQSAGAFSFFDDTVVYHGLDSQVTLNPRYRVNLYFCDHV
ncbi:MAG: hypothetical protein ACYS19_11255, partial [Planctomycetota bacterium]